MTATEAGPLLSRKLDRAFGHLDVDRSGFATHEDLLAIATRLLDAFGEDPADAKGRALIDSYHDFWEAVISAIDLDGDRRIDPMEWHAGMIGAFVEVDGGFEAAMRPAAQATVDVADTDGDGVLGLEEFRTLQAAFGTTQTDAAEGFARLDADDDGHLTADEFVAAARQFYTGQEESPGDWLFGPL